MSYKRIMLAIDKDEISNDALNETIDLAKTFRAKLCIVHVVDEVIISSIYQIPDIQIEKDFLENSSEEFLKSMAKIAHDANIETETKLLTIKNKNQRIAFEVANAAKEWSADLLVIGAYSRSGFHKLLLGHVAESILRITTVPILILHTKRNNNF